MRDFELPKLPGAKPGSGKLKMYDFEFPELRGARPGSGEQKMRDFGLTCQEPGLAPVNQKCVISV